jgi:hypothetical protein
MVVLNSETKVSSASTDSNQDLLDQLAVEFRDSASDLLSGADDILSAARDGAEISAGDRGSLYRVGHSMKGLAASFG